MVRKWIVVVAALAFMVACGVPGVPEPPSLQLPSPPKDLTATRKGNRVILTWTPPRETSDGENLRPRWLGVTRICRGADYPLNSCNAVGQLEPAQTPIPDLEKGGPKAQATDTLQPALSPSFVTYAVEATNSRGRAAGLSNQLRVPAVAVPAPPTDLQVRLEPEGAALTATIAVPAATDLHFGLRLYRRQGNKPAVAVAGETRRSPAGNGTVTYTFEDRAIEWEETYFYHVTPVTSFAYQGKRYEVEGDDSPEVTIFTHDVFPPAQPSSLEAVASGVGQRPFIDLIWAPNTEADLAGYIVYRHSAGGAPTRLNSEPLKTPAFRDDRVQPGTRYTYSVSAIDVRGNESSRSAEASEAVPPQ